MSSNHVRISGIQADTSHIQTCGIVPGFKEFKRFCCTELEPCWRRSAEMSLIPRHKINGETKGLLTQVSVTKWRKKWRKDVLVHVLISNRYPFRWCSKSPQDIGTFTNPCNVKQCHKPSMTGNGWNPTYQYLSLVYGDLGDGLLLFYPHYQELPVWCIDIHLTNAAAPYFWDATRSSVWNASDSHHSSLCPGSFAVKKNTSPLTVQSLERYTVMALYTLHW